MENESEVDITTQNEEADLVLEETQEEATAEEVKQEKPVETPEAKLARLKRQAAQLEKKLGVKPEEKEKPKQETKSQSSDLGYAEKAFLLANDIKGADEIALAQKYLAESGKSLDDITDENTLIGKLFRNELKEMREEKTTAIATPKSTRKSNSSPRDSVEYWLNKPFDEVPQEMKAKVVDARLEREKAKKVY